MILCSGCIFGGSDSLIPNYNYAQIFVEKRLSESKGDVEYKKIWDEEKIKKIIDLLNSIPVEYPGDKKENEVALDLYEKGSYILSFLTKKELDNEMSETVYYLALLQNGYIVYSDYDDHEMKIRLVSVDKKPKLVRRIIEMLY